MKKLMVILSAIAAFLSIYAVAAWFQIRGLRIYTIHSSLGAAYANSWLVCAVAAGILWLLVIILACAGRGRKAKKTGDNIQGKTKKARGKSKGKEQLIQPKRPGASQSSAGPASPGFSEMPQSQGAMEAATYGGQARQPLFQEDDGRTEFMGSGQEEQSPIFEDGRTEFIDEPPKAGAGFPGAQDEGRTEFIDELSKAGAEFLGAKEEGQTEFIDEQPRRAAIFPGAQDEDRTEFIDEPPKAGAGFPGTQEESRTEFIDEQPKRAAIFPGAQDESRTEFVDALPTADDLDMSNSWMGEQVKEPADGPLFCGHCGAQLAKGQKFCMKCGTKVGSV